MTPRAKRRFLWWSLGYMLIGGMIGATAWEAALQLIRHGFRQGWIPIPDVEKAAFWIIFSVYFWGIGLVQFLRVAVSVRHAAYRGNRTEQQPDVPPFILQFGWHIPSLILLVMPLLIGLIVAILSSL